MATYPISKVVKTIEKLKNLWMLVLSTHAILEMMANFSKSVDDQTFIYC